jgi:hypothetical protein
MSSQEITGFTTTLICGVYLLGFILLVVYVTIHKTKTTKKGFQSKRK